MDNIDLKNKQRKVLHRRFEGEVVSDSENKTIHVKVESIKSHPKYKKQYKVHKKYAVHDQKRTAKIGDKVLIEECRPISKTKKWRLVEIIK